MADRLLPTQTLTPGQTLTSADGRFRLEFHDGGIRILAFVATKEIQRTETIFARGQNHGYGQGVRLELGEEIKVVRLGPGRSRIDGEPRVVTARGLPIWEAGPLRSVARGTVNNFFGLQNDGNLALLSTYTPNGTRLVNWSALNEPGWVGRGLPDQRFRDKTTNRPGSVIPNGRTVDIPVNGTLAISESIDTVGTILNEDPKDLIGIRDKNRFITIQPGEEAFVDAAPGTLNMSIASELWEVQPNGALRGVAGDASPKMPPGWRIGFTKEFGLRLRPPRDFDGPDVSIPLSDLTKIDDCDEAGE